MAAANYGPLGVWALLQLVEGAPVQFLPLDCSGTTSDSGV